MNQYKNIQATRDSNILRVAARDIKVEQTTFLHSSHPRGVLVELTGYGLSDILCQLSEDYGDDEIIKTLRQNNPVKSVKAFIEGNELTEEHYLCPVTYVPNHADGNAGHADAEQGVLIRWDDEHAFVLYCKGRKVARTLLYNLRFG